MRSSLPWLLAVCVPALLADFGHAQPKETVKLQRIKAAEVNNAIAAFKGKVVVVEIWAEY